MATGPINHERIARLAVKADPQELGNRVAQLVCLAGVVILLSRCRY